jgi:hypothetical protein
MEYIIQEKEKHGTARPFTAFFNLNRLIELRVFWRIFSGTVYQKDMKQGFDKKGGVKRGG